MGDSADPSPRNNKGTSDGATTPRNDLAGTRNDKLKKQLQDDLEALRHRISKLRVEEERNEASVKTLDKQLGTFHDRKHEYQRMVTARKRRPEHEAAEQDAQRQQIATARRKQRESIQEALAKSLELKRDNVDELKRLRLIHECERNLQKATVREDVVARHDAVREEDARIKTKALRQAARRIENIRDQERREVERDTMVRDEEAAKLRRLEKEEERLVRKVAEMRVAKAQKLDQIHAEGLTRPGTRVGVTSGPNSPRSDKQPRLPPITA
jgi:hypothetical protein